MANYPVNIHCYAPQWLYDQCLELVNTGAYSSMSELIRHGMERMLDENSGYVDQVRQEWIGDDASKVHIGWTHDGRQVVMHPRKFVTMNEDMITEYLHSHDAMTHEEWRRAGNNIGRRSISTDTARHHPTD
jgi:Arc/MetJ-type ribon-helix-helix transcriptional regulator